MVKTPILFDLDHPDREMIEIKEIIPIKKETNPTSRGKIKSSPETLVRCQLYHRYLFIIFSISLILHLLMEYFRLQFLELSIQNLLLIFYFSLTNQTTIEVNLL